MMTTIHHISHTHWDREWYLPFQLFRLKLVQLIDNLLNLLAADPEYRHFMLDGQTIALDDYLQIRPERQAEIRRHVQSGRLVIGPWHILPDEFLVSPEATIRNLLQGDRTARQFGPKMMVGYIPDPFGHIGQMPQILRGFGIESACLWRGLGDEPCELWWESPDGSRVLLAYLRDGYGNGAGLPASEPDRFVAGVRQQHNSLAPHANSGHLLLMHGTDHMPPPANTSALIGYANAQIEGDRLIHSTLSNYLAAVQGQVATGRLQLATVQGELRLSKRAHLLPGVLSTRMWIKQRNQACQALLEQWAEPFSTWAALLVSKKEAPPQSSFIQQPSALLRQAWRLLMECHPHDSICGCSIDQVHDEMRPRFDQVEQIGEEVVRQSLGEIAAQVDTRHAGQRADGQEGNDRPLSAILVFNPISGPRTDSVTVDVQLPPEAEGFEIIDQEGKVVPHQANGLDSQEIISLTLSRQELKSALSMVHDGRVAGMALSRFSLQSEDSLARLEIVLSTTSEPDLSAWQRGRIELEKLLNNDALTTYTVSARSAPSTAAFFIAHQIPGHGYRTYWVRPIFPSGAAQPPARLNPLARAAIPLAAGLAQTTLGQKILAWLRPAHATRPPFIIQNEFLTVEASAQDGTLAIRDQRSGMILTGINRFVDGGDCGDEYNYSPPSTDHVVQTAHVRQIHVSQGHAGQTLDIHLDLRVPGELAPDRKARGAEQVTLPITTRVRLAQGTPRIDIFTEVDNLARDHRLRVHFPTSVSVQAADVDGHFEIIRRPLDLPAYDNTWAEQPRPEQPQRAFCDVSDGKLGLMIANRGLPEIEVLRQPNGNAELALTLLRCVGWLSRDDFSTRKGHAGPMIATPEAQMLGRHSFDYAIIPHAGGWQIAYREAYAFNAPLRAVSAPCHPGKLPPSASLMDISPASSLFSLSAIKAAEDDRGWIVRGCNLSNEPLEIKLTPWQPFRLVERVNLAEQSEATLSPANDGSVTVTARGREIVTLRFSN